MLRTNVFRLSIIFVISFIVNCSTLESESSDKLWKLNAPGDPSYILTTLEFELVAELVGDNAMGSVTQAFSIGRESIALTVLGQEQITYWNYLIAESYLVKPVFDGKQTTYFCVMNPIDQQNPITSIVAPNTLLLKPSVLLGYERSLAPVPRTLNYQGTGRARHLIADIFTSSFNVPDIKATAQVTYYILNETVYPGVVKNNQPPIVQMDVSISTYDGSKTDRYSYNIFSLNPSPRRRELRQALETPEGVYCQGRSRGFRLPEDLPERAVSNSEGYVPDASGLVITTHGSYDTEADITRAEYRLVAVNDSSNLQHVSILHDFLNGLSYVYDYKTRECAVQDIKVDEGDATIVDGQPNIVGMATPRHLFQFDDVSYQYTGEKPCRDRFMCNVWIGIKNVTNGGYEYREWYWATSINDEPLRRWIPMKYVVKSYDSTGKYLNAFNSVFYNYRARSLEGIFEADINLAECYRALGPANNFNLASLSFRLNNDAGLPVMRNLNYLIFHAAESLIFGLRVRPLRISTLRVDQEGKDIIVSFTLLDAPPRRGPVETFYTEPSLSEAIGHLKKAIDSGNFVVRARARDRQVLLFARQSSLNSDTASPETVSSGPRITALWIVFVVVGLLVGIIAGLFVLKKVSPK